MTSHGQIAAAFRLFLVVVGGDHLSSVCCHIDCHSATSPTSNSIYIHTMNRRIMQEKRRKSLHWSFLWGLNSLVLSNGLVTPSSISPERVVEEQLRALKESKMSRAFGCYSPESREVIGDDENFEELVTGAPFDAIIDHKDAQVLLITQLESEVASCLVRIIPNKKLKKYNRVPCLHYWWELSKREDEDEEDNEGSWMVDAFMPDFDDMEFEAVEVIEDDSDFFDVEF